MSTALEVLMLCACVLASAIYSGSETALYSLSRARVDLEARAGSFRAGLVRRLLEADAAVLVTILIGNNLVLEYATHQGENLLHVAGVPDSLLTLTAALVLTPLLFFAGELLPKDLFRQRPHTLLGLTAPVVWFSRWAFWPLERLLSGLSALLERALGLEPRGLVRLRGREALLGLFEEGARGGLLHHHAGELAQNVLRLRTTPVSRVMVPWKRVACLDADQPAQRLAKRAASSAHSRLPVVEPSGRVVGYLHQLDVLAGLPSVEPLGHLRTLVAVPPETPVDRALAKLRASGQRVALVGTAEAPVGLVSLKDLVEEISGELAGW